MIHILTEENLQLRNRVFPIPPGIRSHLRRTLASYKGDKTINGYKRLNNLISTDAITYSEMRRIKNYFDTYAGPQDSTEYILNGGNEMKLWVNTTLSSATNAIRDFKEMQRTMGVRNAFRKPHTKSN